MFKTALISIIFLLSLAGCSRHPMDPEIEMKPPKYVEQMPPKEDERTNANVGSLFGLGESPLYSDRKAMKVNDIVRVQIRESATSSSSSKRKFAKTQKDALGAGVITPGVNANNIVKDAASRADGFTSVGFQANSNYNFDGSGDSSRKESFSTTISARVIKVMPNNTYFIDGARELLIDGEKQLIRVSGVIRSDDITQSNLIDSTYISDAKIMYETEGVIRNATNQAWGSKLLESVWPF